MRRLAVLLTASALLTASVAQCPVFAQDYPSKPLQVISPAAAGNSPDVAMRVVSDKLASLLKQQIVILNRPGAQGLIAAQAAASAVPDGYTLYMAQASTFTVTPVTQEKMPLDLDKSFMPIGLIATQPIAVSVNPKLGVNTLAELMDLIKKTPGGMQFGASNRGGISHLTGEFFARRTKLPLTFISAQGASTTINDVAAGRIPIIFEGIASVAGATEGGLLKTLAVGSAKRLPNYPDLPTIAETVPGFETKGWLALMAPAGTDPKIVQKLSAELQNAVADSDVQKKLAVLGSYPSALSPAETAAFIKREEEQWWPLVREVGVLK
ncbi:MAG: tripartite tricarboxylate transporter substrate binding protein [Pseudolabrys sp.]|nr:tripartite tricarboxylate transporter substrate binding protein [Pseudolabrys sp.]